MSISAALVAGALIIAGTIALTSHWTITSTSNVVGAFRLNRWTGEIVFCSLPLGQGTSRLNCESR
jgi:hypothetical protein